MQKNVEKINKICKIRDTIVMKNVMRSISFLALSIIFLVVVFWISSAKECQQFCSANCGVDATNAGKYNCGDARDIFMASKDDCNSAVDNDIFIASKKDCCATCGVETTKSSKEACGATVTCGVETTQDKNEACCAITTNSRKIDYSTAYNDLQYIDNEDMFFATFAGRDYCLDVGGNGGSRLQKKISGYSSEQKIEVLRKIVSMGQTKQTAIDYVFPNFAESVNKICKALDVPATEPMPLAIKNTCKINIKNAKNGQKIDKIYIYNNFYENYCNHINNKIELKLDVIYPLSTYNEVESQYVLAGSFYTSFASSGEARKNNIRVAAASFDGLIIKNGQTVSFNSTTGARNEQNGYKKAKIIVGGDYTDGLGGGVCQVSTTIYNACLLSGLTISEVHNHSLPASYVSPCFDAMVNMGTSDLKIANNTGGDCIITTSTANDICKVAIFGRAPNYKIVRRFEKYQDLPAGEDIIETDASKFSEQDYNNGTYRITYPIDGFRAKGFLDYYQNDELVFSKQIRDDTYRPRKGVVLQVE